MEMLPVPDTFVHFYKSYRSLRQVGSAKARLHQELPLTLPPTDRPLRIDSFMHFDSVHRSLHCVGDVAAWSYQELLPSLAVFPLATCVL